MSNYSRLYKWLVLGVATYSFITLMINFTVFPVVSEEMAGEIGLGYAQIGLLMAALSISYAIVQIPTGMASDRFGGSSIASLSVLILGLSGLLFAFAETYSLALIARILLGLSGGLLLPATMRLLPRWFTAAEYDKAMGIYGTGQGIAIFVTLISMPIVVSLYGWRTSLVFAAALTLLAAAFSIAFLRDKGKPAQNVLSKLRLKDLKEVLTGRLLILTSFNITSVSLMTGTLTWLPLFLLQELDFALIQVGYITAVMGVTIIASSYAGGALSNKIGGKKVMFISMVLCVISPLLLIYSSSSIKVFAISALIGWAIMLYFGPTFGAIPNAVKTDYVGFGFGIFNTLTFIGSFITAAVTGFVLESTRSFNLAFITISLVSLLGLVGSLIYLCRKKD